MELVEVAGDVAVAGGDGLAAGGVSGEDRGEFVRGPGFSLAATGRARPGVVLTGHGGLGTIPAGAGMVPDPASR